MDPFQALVTRQLGRCDKLFFFSFYVSTIMQWNFTKVYKIFAFLGLYRNYYIIN